MACLETTITKFNREVLRYAKLIKELEEHKSIDDWKERGKIFDCMNSCKLNMFEIIARLEPR